MLRRPLLNQDDLVHPQYYHQTSPRKWRSYNWHPELRKRFSPPFLEEFPWQGWIGKKLIYWNGESVASYVANIRALRLGPDAIGEYEIARALRPNSYRIIFTDWRGRWRSKPTTGWSAGRVNLFVLPNDVIWAVKFF